MAKQTLKISNLSGGINNVASSRDIDDTQLVEAKNINLSQPGLIKSSGAPISPTTPEDASVSGSPVKGTGFYSYSSDYKAANYTSNIITNAVDREPTNSTNWVTTNAHWSSHNNYLKFAPTGAVADESAATTLAVAQLNAIGIENSAKYIVQLFVNGSSFSNGIKLYIRGGSGYFFNSTSTEITADGWYHFELDTHSDTSGDNITIYGQATNTGGNIQIHAINIYKMTIPQNTNYKILYDSGDTGLDTYIDTGVAGTSDWLQQSNDYNNSNLQLTNGATAEPVFTTVDGNLRVTDANFNNTNLPVWRGYINKSLFGTNTGIQAESGSSQSNNYLPGFYNYSSIIEKPPEIPEAQTFTTNGTAPSMSTADSYMGLKTNFTTASDVDYLIGGNPGSTANGVGNAAYSVSGSNGGGAVASTAQGAGVNYYDSSYKSGSANALGENFAEATLGTSGHSTDEGYFLYTKTYTQTDNVLYTRVGTQFAFNLGANNFKINFANGDSLKMEIKGFGQTASNWNSLEGGDSKTYYMWLTICPNNITDGLYNDIQNQAINIRSLQSISKSWANDGNWHTIEWKTDWHQTGSNSLSMGQAIMRNHDFNSTTDYHSVFPAVIAGVLGVGYGFRIVIAGSSFTNGTKKGPLKTHVNGNADGRYIGFRNFHIARGGGAGNSIGQFTFYYSWLYDDEKIESELTKINTTPITLFQESDFKYAPYIKRSFDHNKRIVGARLYFKKNNESEKFFMQEIDFIKGIKPIGEENFTPLNITERTINSITAYSSNLIDYHGINGIEWSNKIITFQSNVGTSDNFKNYKYKTSLILNRRKYIGNIGEIDSSGKVIKRMGDRLMKSSVNQFDKFPENNFVDVAVNDGEEITYLAHFADRILQYKTNDLYIINISKDYEFLEAQHKHIGVLNSSQVTSTEIGIMWINNRGLYLYDGNQIHNLIDGRLKEDLFLSDENKRPCIAYDAINKKAIIALQSEGSGNSNFTDGWSFCLKTFSFIKLTGMFNNINTNTLTNFINTNDGSILWAKGNSIYKWSNTPNNDTNLDTNNNKEYEFITKDFDFDDPSSRKKISKIYVTYKTHNGSNSGVYIKYAIDGSGSFSNNTDLTGVSNYTNSSNTYGLLNTGSNERLTAEIKPTVSLTAKTLQLKFYLSAVATANAQNFIIEDISIVYRAKTIK